MSKDRFKGLRRTGALCTVLALTMGVVIALAAPASAVPPLGASNFNPQTSILGTDSVGLEAPYPNTLLLSDKFDGVEDDPATTTIDESRSAHLTVVATPETTQVIWYVCPFGTYTAAQNSGAPQNAVVVAYPPAGTCVNIGFDDTPNVALPAVFPGGNIGSDEAYELHWDIPSNFDEVARDVVSFACVFGPNASSCTGEAERALLDDAASPAFDSSAGELRWWCVDVPPLGGTPDAGDCDTQIHSLRHGSTVPTSFAQYLGGRLIVNARFSADVNNATLCVDFTADAHNDPNSCDFSDDVTAQAAQAYADGFFAANLSVFPANSEMAFFIYESDRVVNGGEVDNEAGFCDTNTPRPIGYAAAAPSATCLLDTHYVVSSTPFPAQVHATNDDVDPDSDAVNETVPGDQIGAVGPTGADGLCEAANRRKSDNVPAGHFDNVIGCVFDQFADDDFPFPAADSNKDNFGLIANETVSFVITPGITDAKWAFCEGGVISADGLTCTTSNANALLADRKYEADWRATVTGTVIITFCVDPEGVFGDGCANAPAVLTDVLTKTVVPGAPQHVHLRLHEEAITSTTCHPGTASFTANVNTRVDLQGCLFDAFHNGINDERVIWRLETQGFPAPGGDDPAHFVNVPEQTTHVDNGHDGRANATVTAGGKASGHLTNVFFCLDSNLNGECDDFQGNTLEALFQISWKGPACIRGTSGGDTLRGTAGPDCIRGLGGNDRIFGGRGADTLYGGFGDDVIHAGPGKDTVIGGPGTDVCWVRGGTDIAVGCEIIKHGA